MSDKIKEKGREKAKEREREKGDCGMADHSLCSSH